MTAHTLDRETCNLITRAVRLRRRLFALDSAAGAEFARSLAAATGTARGNLEWREAILAAVQAEEARLRDVPGAWDFYQEARAIRETSQALVRAEHDRLNRAAPLYRHFLP